MKQMRGSNSGTRGLRLLVLALLLSPFQILAQQSPVVRNWTGYPVDATFQRMSLGQEQSQSTILCSLQDSRGLLWFGTEYGLNLYDGTKFTVFHHIEGREDTLGADWINCLLEDSRGYLWVGTYWGGLSRIDLHNMTIHSTFRDSAPIPMRDVLCLQMDSTGNLWISMRNGLCVLPKEHMPPASQRFLGFPGTPGDPSGLPDPWVTCTFQDSRGTQWVGTKQKGLCRVRKGRDGQYVFELLKHDPSKPESSPPPNVEAIAEDEFGVIWIGTAKGLYSYFPEQGRFKRYLPVPGDPHGLSAQIINRLYLDRQRTMWAATDGGGLARLLPRDRAEDPPRFEIHRHQAMNLTSLAGDGVSSISQDRSGVLWVGSYQTGLSKLLLGRGKTPRTPVVQYASRPLDPASLSGDLVNAIIEDREGNLWVGTDGAGINRVIPPKSSGGRLRFERFRADPSRSGALQDDAITALYRDREDRLWAGTYTGGLVRIDFPSGSSSGAPRFFHYRNQSGDSTSLSSNFVTSIYEDSKRRMWVVTVNGGLNRFDVKTGKFKAYRTNADIGIITDTMYSIAEDRFGMLWLGCHPGVQRFNPETGKAKAYLPGPGPDCLSHPISFVVQIDSKGILWVGTNGGGLNEAVIPPWDGPAPKFLHFGTEQGLPSNVVRGIAEDAKGRLWLSTSRALCRFYSQEGKGYPFPWRPELNNEYIRNSFQVFRSGEIAFGGTHGFCIFNPGDITSDAQPPAVAITDLKLSGDSVPAGATFNGRVLLGRSIQETSEIILTPREKQFSLEFAALHYASPERNQYAYMMEGLDHAWNYSGNRNFVTYTTLPPGEYRFRVRASNCDGVWNDQGTNLRIKVLPPWWMRLWFRGLMLLLLAGMVYLIIWTRLKVLHARNQILEGTVTARTRELAEANEALRNQSLTDPLTGLRNRRFLYACMPEDVAQVQRAQRNAVLNSERMKLNVDVLIIMVDIDHFKDVNDRHGHHAGDLMLRQMSSILQTAVRGTDTVVRWGGEEFLIIARNSARADATTLPERIRSAVESYLFDIGETEAIRCTCSLGFSVFPFLPNASGPFTWEQIVDVADACLYAAKRNGRNAWVGVVPEVPAGEEPLPKTLPGTVPALMKAQIFAPLTSIDGPVHWED